MNRFRFDISDDYSDMMDMEHVVVSGHTGMSMAQRAAQFAPFAALSTHQPEEKE